MKKSAFILSSVLLTCAPSHSQSTEGPNSPSSGTNNASIGTVSWSFPSYINSADDTEANAADVSLGTDTQYLVGTQFGFAIPDGSTILGIQVEIRRSAIEASTPGSISVSDNSVRIVKGGSIVGDEKAITDIWPVSDTYQGYGGSSDLWGVTWDLSEINAPDFGVAISANLDGAVLPRARVDHIRITVTYSNPLSADLSYFSTECHNGKVTANWGIVAQQNNAYFTLERSEDQHHYQEVGRVEGQGTTNEFNSYELEDTKRVTSSTWYRLSQTDYDGQSSILATKQADCKAPLELQLYPNPSESGYFIANYAVSKQHAYCLTVHDLRGVEIKRQHCESAAPFLIDGSKWPPGIYLVQLIENECIVATERLVIQ